MPILSAHAASRMLDRCIDASKIDAALADGVRLGHRCGSGESDASGSSGGLL